MLKGTKVLTGQDARDYSGLLSNARECLHLAGL